MSVLCLFISFSVNNSTPGEHTQGCEQLLTKSAGNAKNVELNANFKEIT